jgi:hypothetical protein
MITIMAQVGPKPEARAKPGFRLVRAALAYKNVDITKLLLETSATPVHETDVPSSVSPGDDESSDYDSDEGFYNLDSF